MASFRPVTVLPNRKSQVRDQSSCHWILEYETAVLMAMIVLALLLLVQFVLRFNINWDEFLFLSKVHHYLAGDLSTRLQSFYVHGFTWLTGVSENEADQIVTARLVMLILHSLTAFFLYRIAGRATDRPSALFATLAYLSMSYVFRGGSSFRADPIAIFFILAAFDLVVLRNTNAFRTAFAGVLFGIAGMVTIKTAIFFPSFIFILALPTFLKERRTEAARHLALGLGTAIWVFALFYWVHDLSLANAPMSGSSHVASIGFAKTLRDAGFFPQFSTFLMSLLNDFGFWAFILAGGILTLRRLTTTRETDRLMWFEISALAAPLGALLVYRNSFPYFYGFLMAPVAILVAVAWQALSLHCLKSRTGLAVSTIKLLALAILLFNLIIQGTLGPRDKPLEHQRQVLGAIHRVFPESVPYFDRGSIVASFPQAGIFMSTWGMDSYREAGKRVFSRAIAEKGPPLLIADHPLLDLEHKVYPTGTHYGHLLFPEDRAALDSAYVHHWGPIYVAGTQVILEDPARPRTVTISVAGPYTLETEQPIMIDGKLVQPGENLTLDQGPHEIWSRHEAPLTMTLRWGKDLYRPLEPAPNLPFFLGF